MTTRADWRRGGNDSAVEELVASWRNREEAAIGYARQIGTLHPTHPLWAKLNRVIIRRWSESGLRYIKRLAWKAVGRGYPR